MNRMHANAYHWVLGWLLALLCLGPMPAAAEAVVAGVTGTTFNLTARDGYITTGDFDSIYTWGYALDAGPMQYPGPTLIVDQGQAVTVNLSNGLEVPVSIVFPGQGAVGAVAVSGSTAEGQMTLEAGPGGTVSYTFTADRPGTYMYHSGTRPDLQVEMGLVGALIVRPAGFNQASNRTAYGHPGSAYVHEYLFLLTEMDPEIHALVAAGHLNLVDTTTSREVLWFINGRNAPDTFSAAGAPWLPHQPYNASPRTRPGETVLMRVIGGGRQLHPLHTHGNNLVQIARDGRLLQSAPGMGPDLGISDFTLKTVPGETYDALWEWTGAGLGWDIYGHAETDPMEPNEYAADHGKPFPVILPELQDLTFGGWYSGSPFLGVFGSLPPGEGGLNLNGGLFFMFHSHTEIELTNNDIFPGGMMTMMIIEPPGTPIP